MASGGLPSRVRLLRELRSVPADELSLHPVCPICKASEIARPHETYCGHVFCRLCIEQWLHTNQVTPNEATPTGDPQPNRHCPVCRTLLYTPTDADLNLPLSIWRDRMRDRRAHLRQALENVAHNRKVNGKDWALGELERLSRYLEDTLELAGHLAKYRWMEEVGEAAYEVVGRRNHEDGVKAEREISRLRVVVLTEK